MCSAVHLSESSCGLNLDAIGVTSFSPFGLQHKGDATMSMLQALCMQSHLLCKACSLSLGI